MRFIQYSESGEPGVLEVESGEQPVPSRGEVVVETRATSVNPIDTKLRSGQYQVSRFPVTPGSDVAGIVVECGAGVTRFDRGDRVFGTGHGRDGRGTAAEYVAYPTDWLVPLPDSISFEEGAAVALVGRTAWRALITHGLLTPGDVCLIHGGSGGVGHIAVQLGLAGGGRVVTTAGSKEGRDLLTKFGAVAAIDYQREDLADTIKSIAPGGVDLILDHRLNEYLPLDVEVAGVGCRILTIAGDAPEVTNPAIRRKELTIQGVSGGHIRDLQTPLTRLAQMLVNGDIEVVIQDLFPFEEFPEAHRVMEEERVIGKLVVTV